MSIQVPTEQITVLLSSVLRRQNDDSALDFVDNMTWILVTGLLIGQMKASEVYRFLIFERPHIPLLKSTPNEAISGNEREPTSVPTKMQLSEATDSLTHVFCKDIRRLPFSDSCTQIWHTIIYINTARIYREQTLSSGLFRLDSNQCG